MKNQIYTFFFILSVLWLFSSCSTSSKKSSESPSTAHLAHQRPIYQPIKLQNFKDYFVIDKKLSFYIMNDETLNILDNDSLPSNQLNELKKNNDELFHLSHLCKKSLFQEARNFSFKIYHRFKKIPAYWNNLASCYLKQEKMRLGLLYLNYSLEIDNNYLPALNNIGVMYSLMGEDQKAQIAWEKALKKDPFSKTIRLNLAKLYLKYGLHDLSLPLYMGLFKEGESQPQLLIGIGFNYLLKNNVDNAFFYLSKISKKDRANPSVGLQLVYAYLLTGKLVEAQKLYRQFNHKQLSALKEFHDFIKVKFSQSEALR